MTPEQLLARATDPRQYDTPDFDWVHAAGPGSLVARLYEAWLAPEIEAARPRAAVDVGCGTGYLYPRLREAGAARVTGIEPSAANAAAARRAFPGLELIEAPLQQVSLRGAFDLAVAVMSFEHQPDLADAFGRVHALLAPGGRFLLVTGDPEFHLTPRFGLGLESHPRPDGSLLVATTYPYGTLHDIVRPPGHYAEAGRRAGFARQRRLAVTPTADLIASDPRWRAFEGRAVGHLFVLSRDGDGAP